jgi:twitching motility protein PilU
LRNRCRPARRLSSCIFHLITEGLISKEEGLANADSANNLLWLLNNEISPAAAPAPEPELEEKREEASFTEFTLNL